MPHAHGTANFIHGEEFNLCVINNGADTYLPNTSLIKRHGDLHPEIRGLSAPEGLLSISTIVCIRNIVCVNFCKR